MCNLMVIDFVNSFQDHCGKQMDFLVVNEGDEPFCLGLLGNRAAQSKE
jgi:hypothetical protein